MFKLTENDEPLLREVVGDDKNDNKRKVIITEDEDLELYRTGGSAES